MFAIRQKFSEPTPDDSAKLLGNFVDVQLITTNRGNDVIVRHFSCTVRGIYSISVECNYER
jgi:hypothetical protein